MNLKDIKELPDRAPVDSVRGIIEKQYAPQEPNNNDLKYQQVRQNFLLRDDEGNKLMITLMKEALHVLDCHEGQEMTLTAGRNEKGEDRGLVMNKWRPADSQYDKISLKVWPEATIRILPPGGKETATASAPSSANSGGPAPEQTASSGSELPDELQTDFGKEMTLCAFGYCLCLDAAQKMVEDRKWIQADARAVQAIATNLWMSSKHLVKSLAPNLHGTKGAERGAAPAAQPPTRRPKSFDQTPDQNIIDRCLKGHSMDNLDENATRVLAAIDEEMDARGLWDKAYDQLVIGFLTSNGDTKEARDAINQVYDLTQQTITNGTGVEKFFVGQQDSWRESVIEQMGRNG